MVRLDFEKLGGIVPCVVQDDKTGEVLMVAFMNREAFEKTLKEKKAYYYSRSRKKLWMKGETSGNYQIVKHVLVDCDNDTILLKVEQVGGAACHTGYRSCFYRELMDDGSIKVVSEKVFDPKEVYGE